MDIAHWSSRTVRHGWAVIGIPLSAQLGMRQVIVRESGARQELEFPVVNKQYASQSLKVAPRQVDLSAADLARVNGKKSASIMHSVTGRNRRRNRCSCPQPVPGPRSSSFGSRRIFNGQSRNPHSGMDIAAPTVLRCWRRSPHGGDTGEYFSMATRCSSTWPRPDQHVLPLERDRREGWPAAWKRGLASAPSA